MGNCWPSPVNHHSQCTTKPSSPVQKDAVPSLEERNLKSKEKGARTTASPPAHGGGIAQEMPPSGQIVTPKLKMFTYAELMKATREFRPDTVLGEGGFGRVFKGWVDEETLAPSKVGVGMPVAVKKLNSDSSQGFKEWQSEVKFLGKLSHPNLVRLLGYCWEDNQFLLVYEHMQKGSLESHLFRRCADPLPWDTRLKIATGAAHGLAFLHSIAKQVIYRDFKPSNILLDGDFNAKLSDFGLAKLGPEDGNSHITTGNIVGTYGYAAPEYVATGRLYVNSDVYGFGVVLLEILTGLRVFDNERSFGQRNLVDWATPLLPDKRKLKKIMDPRLEDNYPPKAAFEAAQLVLSCLQSDPKNRPCMEEVVDALHRISSVEMTNPKKPRSSAADHHRELRGHHSRSPLHRRKYHGNGGGARSPLPGSS